MVRPGASLVVPALGPPGVAAAATQFGMKPRVRSGYALKRLDASEGSKRWVLKDLNRNTFLRLSDNDAHLFELFDGTHSLSDLIGIAEQRFGAAGAPRLARLLADLGERGYLAGVAGARRDAEDQPQGFLRKLFKPREKTSGGSARGSTGSTARGGWVLFTRPALYAIAALIVAGLAAFAYLVIGRYGTPFVVSQRIGLGALVFLLGRFAVVAVHETAHGLAMSSFGRKIHQRGRQARGDLPLRVRGHLGGVVRAAPAADRDQRRRARSRTSRSARSSRSAACSSRARCATSSSSSPSRATSARSSTSTRSSTATATTSSSTTCASRACAGARRTSSTAG